MDATGRRMQSRLDLSLDFESCSIFTDVPLKQYSLYYMRVQCQILAFVSENHMTLILQRCLSGLRIIFWCGLWVCPSDYHQNCSSQWCKESVGRPGWSSLNPCSFLHHPRQSWSQCKDSEIWGSFLFQILVCEFHYLATWRIAGTQLRQIFKAMSSLHWLMFQRFNYPFSGT